MSNGAETLMKTVGGLSFIDQTFKPQLLLSVVAGVRRRFDPNAHTELVDYLQPYNARELFVQHARSRVDAPASRDLLPLELEQVEQARREITRARPDWRSLLDIPVVYRKLADARMSVTSALIPQTIFIGSPSFATMDTLAEVIVHEYAHIWLNFLAETSDLQISDADEVFTLPSGTKGKSVRGVLLAAHFAAAVHSFHVSHGGQQDRARYLSKYLADCLTLLGSSRGVSVMGRCVLTRLQSYAEQIAHCPRDGVEA